VQSQRAASLANLVLETAKLLPDWSFSERGIQAQTLTQCFESEENPAGKARQKHEAKKPPRIFAEDLSWG